MPVCTHCNSRTFVNEDALRQHLKSSSAHPLCSPCNRHFVNEKAYEAHMAARHPPTFDCVKCSRTFRSQSSLEDHYRGSLDHPNCNRCGKGFKNKRLMEEHYGVQHAPVSCPCGPITLSLDELDAHYLASDMHPSCLTCNRGFKDSECYEEHVVSTHENLYCTLCTTYFESPEALSDHYLLSPRHPACMGCCKGFKGEQEFSAHLSSEHATSRATSMPPDSVVGTTGPVQRSSIPIRRPMIRVDSPALSLRPGFGSPIMEMKAPNFSPTILPPPGGVVNELWAMRENMEVPTPRRLSGTNGYASLADGTLGRKTARNSFASPRGPSSAKSERSPLNNLFVTAEQDADNFKAFDHSSYETCHYSPMQESDPIVPLDRSAKNEDSSKIVGMGIKDKQSGAQTMPSCSPQLSSNLHNLASPTSSTSGSTSDSISSSDIPFVVSSPVLSSFFQASERRNAEKAPDLLLSAMATPIVISSELECPNTIEGGLLSIPNCTSFSPTSTSSPDVSSPFGLAALPSISPFATPIGRTSSPRSQTGDTFDLPETQYPLPESPSGGTSASHDIDDAEMIDTVVPFEVVSSDANVSVATVKPLVPVQSLIIRPTPDSLDLGLEDESSKNVVSCPTSINLVSNVQLPFIQTSADDDISYTRHNAEEPVPSLSGSESSPTTAVELSEQAVSGLGQIPGHRALHCRLCQIDTCSDPTATMCGHLFCYKCITKSVMETRCCPVCSTPTLLYCLFRLDLLT